MVLDEVAHGHEVADGAPGGELVGERGVGGGGELADFGGKVSGLLAAEPLPEAVFAPDGQVLFADGFAFEFLVEDGLDRWEIVEPGGKVGAALPTFHAEVELFAKAGREPTDFSTVDGVHKTFRFD